MLNLVSSLAFGLLPFMLMHMTLGLRPCSVLNMMYTMVFVLVSHLVIDLVPHLVQDLVTLNTVLDMLEIHCMVQAYMEYIVHKLDMMDKTCMSQDMDREDIEAPFPMERHMVQCLVFHMHSVCYSMVGRNLVI